MSLREYRSKRTLKKSGEPAAVYQKGSRLLRFCVQKHAARHLHYDLRLEYKGRLLSWAVPKGLSMNPRHKRLAIKVEDHPLEYQYFEGTIPKGNYGAGTVEIWDHGYYGVPHQGSQREIEQYLTQGLQHGHFVVTLGGEKLEGEFVFQKLKKDPLDNSWLIIKKSDSHDQEGGEENREIRHQGKRSKMASFISPMLATLVDEPFNDPDWLFEVKWDGYRALAFIDKKVKLKSRTNQIWNEKFPSIVQNLTKIDRKVILDGELVVLDSNGKSHFQLIQNYQKNNRKDALYYYVFDLLYIDGYDVRKIPLIERKKRLSECLKDLSLPFIRFSDHLIGDGQSLFKEISKKHLEGMVGKRMSSPYQSRRSPDWVKIKTSLRQEVVIGGFTAPRGSRKQLGALLVGVFDDNGYLDYIGHVGGGFSSAMLKQVYHQLRPLIQKKPPFKQEPKGNTSVTWVKPQLICEVSFAEWTKEGVMRQPIFQGLRIDKAPKRVRKELPHDSSQTFLTNLDKIYWKKEKYTKGDLIDYYTHIGPYILPYLIDRPIVLHRYPDGVQGKDFYQKDIGCSHPDWIKTVPIQHAGKVDHYLLIHDLRSLLYAVNLGSIDLHPFISRYKDLERPDYCVLDLDPQGISFEKVIEVALIAHELLDEIQVNHYCKTSGGKGLHICIPLHGKYDYEQSRQFAEILSVIIHKKLPNITSLERNPKKRKRKVYLDCLQNRKGQTIVAPYAVRPRPKALVSTPLAWDEVNRGLDPSHFSMMTMRERIKKKGDLFKLVLKAGVNLKKALVHLQKR